jgi:hypothetical protein
VHAPDAGAWCAPARVAPERATGASAACAAARISKHGLVSWTSAEGSADSVWLVLTPDPAMQLASEGQPVLLGAPLLARGDAEVKELVLSARNSIVEAVKETWRRKLGFAYPASAERAEALWREMEPLMQNGKADWITLWRQLASVAALKPPLAPLGTIGVRPHAVGKQIVSSRSERKVSAHAHRQPSPPPPRLVSCFAPLGCACPRCTSS